MSSTFYSLEIAKSGLVSSQLALNVSANNVSNVGTDGYTREGIDQTAVGASTSSHQIAEVAKTPGMGVSVNSITQYRDEFTDLRYRDAASISGTYNTNSSILSSVAGVLDETKNAGLTKSMQELDSGLQGMKTNRNTTNAETVRSDAKAVAVMLNQYSNQLSQIADEQNTNLTTTVTDANSLLKTIEALNQTIVSAKTNGTNCNNALDTRNLDIDKLANYMNITVQTNSDGSVSLKTGSTSLLDAALGTRATLTVQNVSGTVKVLADGTSFTPSDGTVKGMLQNLNGDGVGGNYYGIPYYQNALNKLASDLADKLNTANGSDLFSANGGGAITAANIQISTAWVGNADVLSSANIDATVTAYGGGGGQSFEAIANGIANENANDLKYNKDLSTTYKAMVNTITGERESLSGVSTDEEAINTTKYQKAFQAASRVISVIDDMLDKLINSTGRVGL